jgi:hypothetical protein
LSSVSNHFFQSSQFVLIIKGEPPAEGSNATTVVANPADEAVQSTEQPEEEREDDLYDR